MSRRRLKDKQERANSEDEASKNPGQNPGEKLGFDEYQCSGNVDHDFHGLCALLHMKNVPSVKTKLAATKVDGGTTEGSRSKAHNAGYSLKRYLRVELETEDPLSARNLKISGWKVDEQIARVLQRMLPSLSKLQSLQFRQARLTDRMVMSLADTMPLCSSLVSLTLEDNVLPERSYYHLLCENSTLTHLSLRNNRIGDEGAHLIGSALSTTKSANRRLLSLNLSFNSIGDAGAAYIAQGLRLNRALLILSLSNNQIGDSGAAHLATILAVFALNHEEVVVRRKLLLERIHPSSGVESDQMPANQIPAVPTCTSTNVSKGENKGKKREASKKDEKPPTAKENPKFNKKASDGKVPQNKGGKHTSREKSSQEVNLSAPNEPEPVEIANPLLEPWVQPRNGAIILPGNTTLTSLNLAGNRITEKSLPLFLRSLETQEEGGGLLRLCLQRNHFSPECDVYVKIMELMTHRNPLVINPSNETEEGAHGPPTEPRGPT